MMYGNNTAAPQQQHSNDIYENNQAKNEKLQYVRKMQEQNDKNIFSRIKRNHLGTKTTKKNSNPSTYEHSVDIAAALAAAAAEAATALAAAEAATNRRSVGSSSSSSSSSSIATI